MTGLSLEAEPLTKFLVLVLIDLFASPFNYATHAGRCILSCFEVLRLSGPKENEKAFMPPAQGKITDPHEKCEKSSKKIRKQFANH